MTDKKIEVVSGSPTEEELRAAEVALRTLEEQRRLRTAPSKWKLAGRRNATASGFREQTARRLGRGDAK